MRTYSHLEHLARKPNDYDVTTSELLYYPSRGFEVRTPADAWYARYQLASPLRAGNWERFRDPRETTYARYTALQRESESFADGLFRAVDDTQYDRRLSSAWLDALDLVLPTLRYPIHGLQMSAAYVGHMAPSGRIVSCALFQTADEIRRIQRLAYRMRQLDSTRPGFGNRSKWLWQNDARWQPLRELIERLLVCYDWGEALVALNLVVKPAFDQAFMVRFARVAEARGDRVLGELFSTLEGDCRWHRAWTVALLRTCIEDTRDNLRAVLDWSSAWRSRALAAIDALAPLIDDDSGASSGLSASIEGAWSELIGAVEGEAK